MSYAGFETPEQLVAAYDAAEKAAFPDQSKVGEISQETMAEFLRLNTIYVLFQQAGRSIFDEDAE